MADTGAQQYHLVGQAREFEWQSRKRRIDPRLAALGWQLVRHESGRATSEYTGHAVAEYPTDDGPADYALFVHGRILGIIEPKKLGVGPRGVLTQAERYARGATGNPFSFDSCRVPFLYEALLKLADAIGERVARARARADKLTQAILARAFRGERVPMEAELARREGREYEPGAVLLERIRRERVQAVGAKAGRRTGQSRTATRT